MSIKEVSRNGKTKYQATAWYDNHFYGSKTFDQKCLAGTWEKNVLAKAVAGTLPPVSERKKKAAEDDAAQEIRQGVALALAQQIPTIVELFINDQVNWLDGKLGERRNQEYRLVGRLIQVLLGPVVLQHFDGEQGAKLIEKLIPLLYHARQSRSKKKGVAEIVLNPAGAPLEHNTVRLRLTALLQLLSFARDKCLPKGADFSVPELQQDKKWGLKLPPAHATPRTRLATDSELASVLRIAGAATDLGELVQALDETGCRLSEMRAARGSQVSFFYEEGQLVGGQLHLTTHKTYYKTKQERFVPLSLVAATLLLKRKERFGEGALFPSFRSADEVCKLFEATCSMAGVADFITKDLRRGFVNRNKDSVAEVDMVKIVGEVTALDLDHPKPGVKAVIDALGHKDIKTTQSYTVIDCRRLARVFTATSRNAAVLAEVQRLQQVAESVDGSAVPRPQRRARRAVQAALPEPTAEAVALSRALGFSASDYLA
jgi:integrase